MSSYSLREIRHEDLDLVLSWRNSERIRNLSYNDQPIQREDHEKWFANLAGAKDRICLVFEISKIPVGVIQFFEISSATRTCKWGFYLGSEDLPKGMGSIMGQLALNYAFEKLPVDCIQGEAISHNESSIRFHKKLGFTEEGRVEWQIHRNGMWQDIVLFKLNRSSWPVNQTGEAVA